MRPIVGRAAGLTPVDFGPDILAKARPRGAHMEGSIPEVSVLEAISA